MKKPLKRGRLLGFFLFAALLLVTGGLLASLFLTRQPPPAGNMAWQIPAAGGAGPAAYEAVRGEVVFTPAAAARQPPFEHRFPIELAATPIIADPWDMLHWPQNQWRDSRFELFAWDRYPEILIIDLATLAIQEDFFHRLAFFAEKAGFRGRLSRDHEIRHLHGWNAHNYRDYDLARFFQMARDQGFPLLPEEWELESILLRAGVIVLDETGRIVPGRGAILTLTRESSPALRTRFMVHEVFHGLFFIDEDFRRFSRERWAVFPDFAREFLLTFFAIQEYDIEYEFLVVNEFMGHLLQLPVAQAAWFFAQHTAGRLYREGFGHVLPDRYEIRSNQRFWPDLAEVFTAETQVFQDHVYDRWGLAAGRVWHPR